MFICINENNNKNKIFPQIKNKTCYILDCSNDWKSRQIKLVNKNYNCIDNINESLNKIFICESIPIQDICLKCDNNYYPMEYENLYENINCYKEPEGYYLDKDEFLYKKCYHVCETCEMKGINITHNCLKCKANFPIEIDINNYTNCYENCNYYHYYDKNNTFYCTFSCPDDYPILLAKKNECIKISKIRNIIQDLLDNKKNETEVKSKEEEIEYYDTILDIIESGFTSDNYNYSDLDNGEEEVIETEKMTVTLTTIQNQKKNTNNNITTINLGECETLLRDYYNILENETLYMKKNRNDSRRNENPKNRI